MKLGSHHGPRVSLVTRKHGLTDGQSLLFTALQISLSTKLFLGYDTGLIQRSMEPPETNYKLKGIVHYSTMSILKECVVNGHHNSGNLSF